MLNWLTGWRQVSPPGVCPTLPLRLGEVLPYSLAEVVIHPLDSGASPVQLFALWRAVTEIHRLAEKLFRCAPGFLEDEGNRAALVLRKGNSCFEENSNELVTDFVERVSGRKFPLFLRHSRNGSK
jgi:hypothetical protein